MHTLSVGCVVRLTLALVALGLGGCESLKPPPIKPLHNDEPAVILQQPVRRGQAGGVFVQDSVWALTSDSRAFRPGDVFTVLLSETTQASKKADSTFGKTSNVTATPSVLLGRTLKTTVGIGAERDFTGTTASSQQNALTGAITVIVQEVLPNGLLRVTGEKTLTLNQGEEFIRLRGYVRSADIESDNTISSQRVANARIAYSGLGPEADSQSPGWLMRFFTGPLMPF